MKNAMTTELVTVTPGETPAQIVPADTMPSFDELRLMVEAMAKSGFFKNVQDYNKALTVALVGREMGIAPAAAITGIHIIEGKPSLGSNLIAGLVKRSGKYTYRVISNTATGCEIEFFEKVAGNFVSIGTSEFTQDDARAAGVLAKDNWKKYPKSMYFARAMSTGARTHCPDVFGGHAVYHEGEIESSYSQPHSPLPATASPQLKEAEATRIRRSSWQYTADDNTKLKAASDEIGLTKERRFELIIEAEKLGITDRYRHDEFIQACEYLNWLSVLLWALEKGAADYDSLIEFAGFVASQTEEEQTEDVPV
jgi:hypothetical protein